MTKVFGILAWSAVAVIAIFGIARGQDTETLVLLCISTAIASIPTGLPTFVQTMLSSGARRLAESKAVVKSLTDVETLGGTTVINSDKTGTLTMNAMTATTMLAGGDWFTIEGGGLPEDRRDPRRGRAEPARLPRPGAGPGAVHRRHRRRRRVDHRRPDRGGARGAGRQDGRRTPSRPGEAIPRRAEVPFDSEYKFMATFHDRPDWIAGGDRRSNRTS